MSNAVAVNFVHDVLRTVRVLKPCGVDGPALAGVAGDVVRDSSIGPFGVFGRSGADTVRAAVGRAGSIVKDENAVLL